MIRNSVLVFYSLVLGKMSPKVYLTPKDGGLTFSVMHYAGKISYNMEGVLDKNRDTLPTSILFTMKGECICGLNVTKCMFRCRTIRTKEWKKLDKNTVITHSNSVFSLQQVTVCL